MNDTTKPTPTMPERTPIEVTLAALSDPSRAIAFEADIDGGYWRPMTRDERFSRIRFAIRKTLALAGGAA